jgi:hypothetical protein
MKTPAHIDRITPDPDGLDFDVLKKTGIAMLQELCGENWTDYNAHDPGVTILEQLCYALTDLDDYLSGPSGQIDFERHALHSADAIFPSQVLTADDYRKIIYDSISDIEDVWIKPFVAEHDASHPDDPGGQGLYTISVKLKDIALAELSAAEHAELEGRVRQRVADVFIAHRNLGEDLHAVVIVRTQAFYLSGDIQIHSLRDPAAIFADIFFRCAQQVISGLRVERYEDVLARGAHLEHLFSGPRTMHGRISNVNFSEPGAAIPIVTLIPLIQAVDGVAHVHRLGLCDANGNSVQGDCADGAVARLQFPATPQQNLFLRLRFASSGVGNYATAAESTEENQAEHQQGDLLNMEKAQIVLDDARTELRKKQFEFSAIRNSVQSLAQVIPAPSGVHRQLQDYYSIQHQFPALYGINRYGVPATAPLKNKVSARQLKAYLFLSEQLIANYLQNLQEIPRLFSTDALSQSYFSQLLDNRALPDIEDLYVHSPAQTRAMLSDIVAGLDKPEDRRSRVIDVLLAMYGEAFSQKSLRRFNYYEERHSEQWLIANKLAFLKRIATLSRDRATGFNYLEPAWKTNNTAGVHQKIAILLALKTSSACHPLSHELLRLKLKPITDAQASEQHYVQAGKHLSALAGGGANGAENGGAEGESNEAGGAVESIPAAWLVKGVKPENYVLEEGGGAVQIYFQPHSRSNRIKLTSHADIDDAERHVQQLRQFICRLNMASEGFHIVEHVLLRRRGGEPEPPDEFHAFRISVVFPSWTARFADPDFRSLAQETVCRNLPAHIYPEFHWLDFPAMRDFEERYRIWLEHMLTAAHGSDRQSALNAASERLVKFLKRHRKPEQQNYWV